MIFFQAFLGDDDREFIKKLYEQYKPWLMFRANRYVSSDDCEEVVHQCFVKLMQHTETLHRLDESQLRAYIAVALDHNALNFAKKASRNIKMNSSEFADLHFVEDKDRVEAIIERKLDVEAIIDNVQHLSKRDRELLKLRFVLELSDKEISDIIGIKKDCVRMTVRRSVLKLQREIEERRGL